MSKALVSPFKFHDGAQIKCLNEKTSISYKEIIKLENNNIIKGEYRYIIELLYEYKYLTSFMLKTIIQSDERYKIKFSNINLKNLLSTLVNNGIILKKYIYWQNIKKSDNENKTVITGTPNIYSLSRGGLAYFVKSNRLKVSIDQYMINESIEEILKILAVNQLLVNYRAKVNYIKDIKRNYTIKIKKNLLVNLYALLNITYKDKDISIIIEPVRRENLWAEKLAARLFILNNLVLEYENNRQLLSSYPIILLLCEDDLHMRQVYHSICDKFPSLYVLYTTDIRQLEDNLSNSLISIKVNNDRFSFFEHKAEFLS